MSPVTYLTVDYIRRFGPCRVSDLPKDGRPAKILKEAIAAGLIRVFTTGGWKRPPERTYFAGVKTECLRGPLDGSSYPRETWYTYIYPEASA